MMKILLIAMTGVFLIGFCALARAEEYPAHTRAYYMEKTQEHVYVGDDGETMPYRLFLPSDYDTKRKYPLVLSLHGAGARGNDNVQQLRAWIAGWVADEVQEDYPCIVLLPQCPKGEKWVVTPWNKGSYSLAQTPITKAMTKAKALFDQVVAQYAVDQDRIYLLGSSMGGYGAWDFTMRYPDVVAAAVPICGAGDPTMIDSIKDIPIWAFHGDQDPTVPPSGSLDMMDASKRVGGTKMKLTMYPGVGHSSFKIAWNEPELLKWLFAQRKSDR